MNVWWKFGRQCSSGGGNPSAIHFPISQVKWSLPVLQLRPSGSKAIGTPRSHLQKQQQNKTTKNRASCYGVLAKWPFLKIEGTDCLMNNNFFTKLWMIAYDSFVSSCIWQNLTFLPLRLWNLFIWFCFIRDIYPFNKITEKSQVDITNTPQGNPRKGANHRFHCPDSAHVLVYSLLKK